MKIMNEWDNIYRTHIDSTVKANLCNITVNLYVNWLPDVILYFIPAFEFIKKSEKMAPGKTKNIEWAENGPNWVVNLISINRGSYMLSDT